MKGSQEGGDAGGQNAAAAEANRAVRAAFESGVTRPIEWRRRQLISLRRLLLDHGPEILASLSDDLSKPEFESRYTELQPLLNSISFMLRHLRRLSSPSRAKLPWYLSLSSSSARLSPEPLGACLIFSPWNYPFLLSLDPLVAAIAAGNSALLKPSELSPSSSSLLARLLPSYLHPSAFTILQGGPDLCRALLAQRWDKIFYTGSPSVARSVMAAASVHLTPVTLELGGKCPVLIHGTADLHLAARRVAAMKWGFNAGQTCIAPDYVVVESAVCARFVEALKETMRRFGFEAGEGGGGAGKPCADAERGMEYGGQHDASDGAHPAAAAERLPGPARIVNAHHHRRLKAMIEEAVEQGAIDVRWWHHNPGPGPGPGPGLRIRPTILLHPPLDSAVMRDEVFGPVLPIVEVDDLLTRGLALVNSKPKPLSVYAFAGDAHAIHSISARTSSGSFVANDVGVQFTLDSIPFGGVGLSGMGSYHGEYGFRAFSHVKPVVRIRGDLASFRYPPYTERKKALLSSLAARNTAKFILVFLGIRKE